MANIQNCQKVFSFAIIFKIFDENNNVTNIPFVVDQFQDGIKPTDIIQKFWKPLKDPLN